MPRRPRRPRIPVVITTPPDVAEMAGAEVADLGVRPRKRSAVELTAEVSTRQLYDVVARSRLAERVMVVVAEGRATSFSQLQGLLEEIDWSPYLDGDDVVRVRVRSHRSKLYHESAIAERVSQALARRGIATTAALGIDADDALHALVDVAVAADIVEVRVDAVGEALGRRGWRGPTAKAPLRPTVAAAALESVGWSGEDPLVDPFCGSGTIVIEGARRALGLAPTVDRPFRLQRWPAFEPGTWASVSGSLADHAPPSAGPPILMGRDRDRGAVEAAEANAAAAGVGDVCDFAEGVISGLEAPTGPAGLVMANPPWGGRLDDGGDLRDLYARIGQVVLERFAGWRLGLVVGDRAALASVGIKMKPVLVTRSGGQRVTVAVSGAIG